MIGQEALERGIRARERTNVRSLDISTIIDWAILAVALWGGMLLRTWQINALGINSDEAVYLGQGASIAGEPQLEKFFPTFRAHPLLFQTILSVGFRLGGDEFVGRLIAAAVGVATVYVTYLLGRPL